MLFYPFDPHRIDFNRHNLRQMICKRCSFECDMGHYTHCRIKKTPIGEVQRFSAPNWQFFQKSFKLSSEKSQNVQFMSNKGVHGTKLHLTNLHTWNLHGKVQYISQTSENSFGTLPQNWTRFHSNVTFLIYLHINLL